MTETLRSRVLQSRVVTSPALRDRAPDLAVLAVLFALFAAVHDLRTWIGAPYMLDEAWVALSTRVPLGDLPHITSSSPIGWTLLLRAVPDPDALRLVPLAFALLAVAAAYAFGRLMPNRGRLEAITTGGLAAAAVVLLPAAQLRHDLKQYTADAALTLSILALAAWVDRTDAGRRRLAVLAAAGAFAFLFSSASPVATAAAFGGLIVSAALRRDWRHLVERAVAAAAAGLVLVVLYLVFVAPIRLPALQEFWRDYYPAPAQLPSYIRERLAVLGPSLGFGRWWVWVVVVVAAVVLIARLRRTATATALVLLPAITALLGVLKVYPLLDTRTSFSLFTALAAAVGVLAAQLVLAGARHRTVVVAALSVAVAGLYAVTNHAWYRAEHPTPITASDVRTQTRWIDEHRQPGDVVVISQGARLGYLYYHDDEPLRWTVSTTFAHGWDAIMPDDPDIFPVNVTTLDSVRQAVDDAVARARQNGPTARVFVMRSWWRLYGEDALWAAALAPYSVSYPYDGVEPITIIDP